MTTVGPRSFVPVSPDLDLRLEVLLSTLADHGRPELGCQEIADLIGCDRRYIVTVTQRALAKMQKVARERRALDELAIY